jgi:hypothetical protein
MFCGETGALFNFVKYTGSVRLIPLGVKLLLQRNIPLSDAPNGLAFASGASGSEPPDIARP